jgi:hypothetical protein
MKSPHKTALKSQNQPAGIRWSIYRAAVEFGIDRRTLARRLASASTEPGPDAHYSTRDIVCAVFTDLETERTRLTKAQADVAELKRGELLRNWMPRELVIPLWNGTLEIMRGIISSRRDLPEPLKADLIRDLQPPNENEYLNDTPFIEAEGPLTAGEG